VRSLDSDGDGKLTDDEMRARLHPARPRRGRRRRAGSPPTTGRSTVTAANGEVADLEAVFGVLDSDRSGVVDETEMPPAFGRGPRDRAAAGWGAPRRARSVRRGWRPRRAPPPARRVQAPADGDSDGKVSQAEWQTLFATLDGNSDGYLDEEELPGPRGPGMGMGRRHGRRGSLRRAG